MGENSEAEGVYDTYHPSCERPPKGWWCSRPYRHDGPCAARRIQSTADPKRGAGLSTPMILLIGVVIGQASMWLWVRIF